MKALNDGLPVINANRRLPARLTAVETAALLGFAEHDMPILMRAKLLKPLGKPEPKASKYFATMEILKLAEDREWLDKATKAVASYWKQNNSGRETGVENGVGEGRKTGRETPETSTSQQVAA